MADLIVVEDVSQEISEEEALEIARLAEEELRRAKAERQALLDNLGQYVETQYTTLKSGREEKKSQWLTALKLFNGPLSMPFYVNEEDRMFKQGQETRPKPYTNIVRSKAKSVISQLIAGQFATGDKNWEIKPSPFNRDVAQTDPAYACMGMSAVIQDQLNDSNYGAEYRKGIEDYVILGTIILKGPNNSCKYKKTYIPEQSSDGEMVFRPQLIPIPQPGVWRVEPWYFFPDTSTNDPTKIERAIEVHPLSRTEFKDLMSHEGFIYEQLQLAYEAGPSASDSELFDFLSVSKTSIGNATDKFIVKEYHGPVDMKCLSDLGVYSYDEDLMEDTVYAEIWVCNGKCIRVSKPVLELENAPPYAMASYEEDPASVFGFGLPLLLESQQRKVKTAEEMLLDNAAISSGPQVVIDKTKIDPAEVGGDYSIRPWKVWLKGEYGEGDNGVQGAMDFFNVPSMQDSLIAFIQYSLQMAEIDSGVNEMIGGLQSPQGAETGGATGLAIANENALTPLLYKQEILVDNITSRVIKWMYHWNMQYFPDSSVKGDFEVDVQTPIKRINSQQQKLDLERLSMEASQNPEMAAKVDIGKLTNVRLAAMRIPADGILRSPEEEQAWREQQQANQPPDPNMLKAEADIKNAETASKKVDVEMARLEFDREEGMRKAELDLREAMLKDQTRQEESLSRLLVAQTQERIAMIENATKMGMNAEKLASDEKKQFLDQQVQLFIAGQNAELKAGDQQIHKEEMQLRRNTGSGV